MSSYKPDRTIRYIDDDRFEKLRKDLYTMRNMIEYSEQSYRRAPTDENRRYALVWQEEITYMNELYFYNLRYREKQGKIKEEPTDLTYEQTVVEHR